MTSFSSNKELVVLDVAATPLQVSQPGEQQTLDAKYLQERVVTGDAGLPYILRKEPQTASLPPGTLSSRSQSTLKSSLQVPGSAPAAASRVIPNRVSNDENQLDVVLEDRDMFNNVAPSASANVEDGAAASPADRRPQCFIAPPQGSPVAANSDAPEPVIAPRHQSIINNKRDVCNIGCRLSLTQLGNRNHTSESLGTMKMGQSNIRLETAVECKSPDATDVILRVRPIIPRRLNRNFELLMKPYKLTVSFCKIQTGARSMQRTGSLSEQFLLKDGRQEWKLLSKSEWVEQDGEIYISIRVVYEEPNVTQGPEFVIINP